jgi:hypothetical protein
MLEEAKYTQTGSVTGTEILSSHAKRPGREFDHSSPSSAEDKKE